MVEVEFSVARGILTTNLHDLLRTYFQGHYGYST